MIQRFNVTESVWKAITLSSEPAIPKLLNGASVQVKDLRGNNLTLYTTETGTTTTANPLTTDALGRVNAWTDAPDHDITITHADIATINFSVRNSAPGVFNVKSYGAKGDGIWNGSTFTGSDDTASIQAAITAASTGPQYGGVIQFTKSLGAYRCTSSIDASSTIGLTIQGEGATADAGTASFPPSLIAYVGGGSGSFFNCRNSYGLTIDKMGIVYAGAFTGILVDARNIGGSDTQFFVAHQSMFGGVGIMTAHSLISWQNAIFCHVEKCHFNNAQHGIRGREESGASVSYSNSMTIRDSSFIRTVSAITNPGDLWTIESCGFEGLQGGGADYLHYAVSCDLTNAAGMGFQFRDNWLGDAFGAQVWIQANRGGLSGVIQGNMFQAGVAGIDADDHGLTPLASTGSLMVIGNSFSHDTAGVNFALDLGNPSNRIVTGVVFTGNDLATGGDPSLRAGGGSLTGHLDLIVGGNRTNNVNDVSIRPQFDVRYAQITEDSASTLPITPSTQLVYLTGTTNITNVSNGYGGQIITLLSSGGVRTIIDGGNLKLRGNFGPSSYGDTLTLVFNNVDNLWHELSRSDE